MAYSSPTPPASTITESITYNGIRRRFDQNDQTAEDKAELANVLRAARDRYRLGKGVTLTAYLLDDGLIQAQLSGLSGVVPPLAGCGKRGDFERIP
jgi:hypothetical protein